MKSKIAILCLILLGNSCSYTKSSYERVNPYNANMNQSYYSGLDYLDGWKKSSIELETYIFLNVDEPFCCDGNGAEIYLSINEFSKNSYQYNSPSLFQTNESVSLNYIPQSMILEDFNKDGKDELFCMFILDGLIQGEEPGDLLSLIYFDRVSYWFKKPLTNQYHMNRIKWPASYSLNIQNLDPEVLKYVETKVDTFILINHKSFNLFWENFDN